MHIKFNFIILIVLNISSFFCHRCGADALIKKMNLKRTLIPSNKINKRKLDDEYTSINIKIDYNIFEKQKNEGKISNDNYQKYKLELDKLAIYINKIIEVQHESFDSNLLSLINNYCEIPITNLGEIDQYDLIIFPSLDLEGQFIGEGILAAASSCIHSQYNNRPIVGVIFLNKELNTKLDIEHYIKNALLHELFHILGFNVMFFKQSYEENNYKYLNSPKLLEKARIHFGCNDIKGLRLEDQGEIGTKGSHWDARYMQGELMIGEDYTEVELSDMTLAFLEDLGFYKIKYYTGGLFRFGKNQGCAFLQKNCVYNEGRNSLFPNEFCTDSTSAFCTGSHTSKGTCYIVKHPEKIPKQYQYYTEPAAGGKVLPDYCPISFYNYEDNYYNYPTNCNYGKKENSDEIIGSNSLCFESSVNLDKKTSICYEIECDKVNKRIKVNIGGKTIICPGKKMEMSNPEGLKGYLSCPDYNMVCTSDKWCNNMFDCIDQQSESDLNTYDFISNRKELEERDKENLLNGCFKIEHNWLYLVIYLIIIISIIF